MVVGRWDIVDEDILMSMIGEIQNQLSQLTSAVEDVRSEVSNVYLNMDDNSNLESKLDDVVTELRKIRREL